MSSPARRVDPATHTRQVDMTTRHASTPAVPVVIVGAGPTGLTAATLLAQHSVPCLVLERWASIYPQPRAVHLDDEVYRILARMGLRDSFAAIAWPCHGLRLVDPKMRVLAEFRRGTSHGRHGYPEANMFDQPELERLLRANLNRFDNVTVQGNVEVTGVTQEGTEPVLVHYTDRATGDTHVVRAQYVLGCDGANSVVRASIGAAMRNLKFEQRWLVVDVATTANLGEWEGVHQVCDPARAATYMRIGESRYRFEFRLDPDETAEDYRDMARLHPRLAAWTKDIPADDLHLVRVAEYTFRAQLADRWRDRRVFLLGDAAHLTPPFIGQGLGAGVRDSANLSWKLAGVLDESLHTKVLDTYEAERKPHAEGLIRLAKLIGMAMTEGGELGNMLRRVLVPSLRHVPGLSRQVLNSETPALRGSDLVARRRARRTLAGKLCPNAPIDDARRFDDVAAGRFAVVTSVPLSPAQHAAIERSAGVVLTVSAGTDLHRWLHGGRAKAALVRPDGTVLVADRKVSRIGTALPTQRGKGTSKTMMTESCLVDSADND